MLSRGLELQHTYDLEIREYRELNCQQHYALRHSYNCCFLFTPTQSTSIYTGFYRIGGNTMKCLKVYSTRLAILIALTTTLGLAQFETATLTGVVTDSAAAVVPKTDGKAINQAPNVEST